jgi:hypothetical protein
LITAAYKRSAVIVIRAAASTVYDRRFDRRNATTLVFFTAAMRCSGVMSRDCL